MVDVRDEGRGPELRIQVLNAGSGRVLVCNYGFPRWQAWRGGPNPDDADLWIDANDPFFGAGRQFALLAALPLDKPWPDHDAKALVADWFPVQWGDDPQQAAAAAKVDHLRVGAEVGYWDSRAAAPVRLVLRATVALRPDGGWRPSDQP